MNRRSFLQKLGLGAIIAPVMAKAAKGPVPDPSSKLSSLPDHFEMGFSKNWDDVVNMESPMSCYVRDSSYVRDTIRSHNKIMDKIILDAVK